MTAPGRSAKHSRRAADTCRPRVCDHTPCTATSTAAAAGRVVPACGGTLSLERDGTKSRVPDVIGPATPALRPVSAWVSNCTHAGKTRRPAVRTRQQQTTAQLLPRDARRTRIERATGVRGSKDEGGG